MPANNVNTQKGISGVRGLRTFSIGTLLYMLLPVGQACAADLLEIHELALHQDPQLRQVQSALEAVRETRPQAQAQLFMPTLEFNTRVTQNYDDITLENQNIGGDGEIDYLSESYRLNLRQPVFHYDRYIQLKQSTDRISQANLDVDAALQELIVRVSERYFDVLAAQDDLTFSKSETTALERQLEEARQRFEVGLIAITDVQEAQAGFDLAQANQILAQNLLDNAHEALREVTRQYHREIAPLSADFPLIMPSPADIDEWTELAMQQNIPLAIANTAAQIERKEIRSQFAGHLPNVDLVGAHGPISTGGRFGTTDIDATSIGVELNVPLFAGGLVNSRVRQAEHRHQQALERLEQQRRAAYRQARDAYLGVVSDISRVKALGQAVVSNETAVKATKAGFGVGTRTTVDVVNAERDLFRARRDFARARYDYILNTLRLKQAAGTLCPDDVKMINTWLTEASSPTT